MNAVKTYFIDVLKNHYIDFNGRATRKQYWMYTLFYIILSFLAGFVSAFLGETFYKIVSVVLGLGFFLPSLSIAARRLHDTDRSAWWLLLLLPFINVIGSIVLLVFFCLPSMEGENRFNK